MKGRIRLRGVNGHLEGKLWESEALLRAGRQPGLEIVLEDSSVSRRHAEVRATAKGWRVRDLGSTNGTFLNGTRLSSGEWPVRTHDVIRFGNITLVVDLIRDEREEDLENNPDNLQVQATASSTWEAALEGLIFDRNRAPRPGEQLTALLRAGHHLGHHESEQDLLNSILNDAVGALDAQRGAIVLAEPSGKLSLRALASGNNSTVPSRPGFSQNLAQRCFARGESILCCSVDEDAELAGARSIAEGAMSSVLCVLLRTPRKRLGVLHLDRGPLQKPFTKDDLFLADALAANVSAGIESASLLRKKDELFYATITMLAQSIELKDDYTGHHIQRVTEYSYLLAQELDLPADELRLIKIGTPLHDIGKIGIDDAILRKPGKLTPAEFEIMKTHTTKGDNIIKQVPDLEPVRPIVRSHHERWDGKGYPDELKGEEISRLARIVGVADAFDAMTSDRPYRKGMVPEIAFAELEKNKGIQFDPEAVTAFLSIRHRIIQEMQSETRKIGLVPSLRVAN